MVHCFLWQHMPLLREHNATYVDVTSSNLLDPAFTRSLYHPTRTSEHEMTFHSHFFLVLLPSLRSDSHRTVLRVCVRWRRIKTYTRARANWRPKWSLRCFVQWIFDSLFTHLWCSAAVFFPHYALRESHCFSHSEAEPDNNWSSCCASKLNIFNHSENCWQRNTRRMEWNQRVLHVKIGLFIARENDLPQFIEAEVYRCWAMMGWHFTIKKINYLIKMVSLWVNEWVVRLPVLTIIIHLYERNGE